MKFQRGDLVRIINNGSTTSTPHYLKVGSIGVIAIDGPFLVEVTGLSDLSDARILQTLSTESIELVCQKLKLLRENDA